MSHMHELGLGTLLCSHKTNPFVVQPYEPISLIVLPHRLLVCRKPSKPSSFEPWHTRNHHTMDSLHNSNQREQNYSLPIVRPTHVITILRTRHHLAADGNYTVPCPSCIPPSSTSQTPIRLSRSSPNTTTQVYNSYTLGTSKQPSSTSHTNMKLVVHSLKPGIFAQASPSASLKLPHLA